MKPGAGGAKKLGVAVLEIRALGTVDERVVAGLIASEITHASEQAHFPLRVIAGSDFIALVGYEKQRALMGCTDTACLAEIGGALGVDYLVSSEVSVVGGVWLLSSTLLDIRKATAITRTTKKIKALSDMPDAASDVTAQLMSAMPLSKLAEAPPAAAFASVPLPEAGPKDSVVDTRTPVIETPGTASVRSKRRTLAYALGGGALFLGAGITFNVLARAEFTKAQNLRHDAASSVGMDMARDASLRYRALSWAGYGIGAAGLGLGAYFAMTRGAQSASPAPTVGVAPMPGGGMLTLEGGF